MAELGLACVEREGVHASSVAVLAVGRAGRGTVSGGTSNLSHSNQSGNRKGIRYARPEMKAGSVSPDALLKCSY
ncbi:hypothetical protein E2C01_068264 [Portunus trituberculatus]|uniref:Uncharacterized protein n=1 Tax=Portunus trituberculatus TaxID=210409 RepID=A0A5B7HM00_PORTR|nr:hypothetical protein [Portunus trituberculatus]